MPVRSLQPSSPHTRGYFRFLSLWVWRVFLFPAHAGVFPTAHAAVFFLGSLPRTRGGISEIKATLALTFLSSPHTRGYFRVIFLPGFHGRLFPAHAGVFPDIIMISPTHVSLPRTRGGISGDARRNALGSNSSPHTRGYFRRR